MVASIGAVAAPSQGASYYERDGYYAKDDPDHRAASAWAGKGAEELGLKGPGRSRGVQGDTRRQGAGRLGDAARPQGQGRRDPPPSRPRPDLLGPEVGFARRAGRRRRAHRRRPRPGGRAGARLVREERRRNPDEGPRNGSGAGSGDRAHGPGREPEGRDRHLPARHLSQSRPGAAHPFGDRQHGPGRRRQVEDDGQRAALRLEDAVGRALPERACGRTREARLRHREDACRRALRDRGGIKGHRRGVLDAAGGDRGGDGSPRPR